MEACIIHKSHVGWDELPCPVLLEMSKHLQGCGSDLAAMRQTCKQWRSSIESLHVNLKPIGSPYHYQAFPFITSIDFNARSQGPAVTTQELDAISNHARNIKHLDLSSAHQVVNHLNTVSWCSQLTSLVLDDTPIADKDFSSLILHENSTHENNKYAFPASLSFLSLRGCSFLTHTSLHTITRACHRLVHLDMADCGLSLHLHVSSSHLLASLTSLVTLHLGGNSVSDACMATLAQLPNLLALSLRDSTSLTEIGLNTLASGPCGHRMLILDVEGCSGLGEGSWHVLGKFKSLKSLSLARLPQLLQAAPIAEQDAAALWRWPHLQKLDLAGSAVHPAKLKLLASTCGESLQDLDVSMPPGGVSHPYLNRIPPTQVRDLLDAARSLRHLRTFRAARSGMPLEAIIVFMRAAQKLENIDVSGCCLAPWLGRSRNSVVVSAGSCWWTSGMQMPNAQPAQSLLTRSHSSVDEVSSALTGPGPEEFAAALGALHATLSVMRFEECLLSGDHLCHVSLLKKARVVSVAGNRAFGDAELMELGRCAERLEELDVSGTSITDLGLEGFASRAKIVSCLRKINLSRCTAGVTSRGVAALASRARELNLGDCTSIDFKGVQAIAKAFPALERISLAGCSSITAQGVVMLCTLCPCLRDIDLARCGVSVDDDALAGICSQTRHLTRLNINGAHRVTRQGISALKQLPCLSSIDLTCCTNLGKDDEEVGKLIEECTKTAVAELPQGSKSKTGNVLKRAGGARIVRIPTVDRLSTSIDHRWLTSVIYS